jgi:predicted DNA-binding protein
MATKNPRINVAFDDAELFGIKNIAKKNKKSLSATIKELVSEALELREDYQLSKIADKRLSSKSKLIPQEKVWEELGL